ncbi:hypothetical protein IDH50_16055 [Aeromicrobium tamlense]|uniref:Uracil-DNA glycosylase-like domain-containing protein n=1 Tax=Aeromicrobium tamlense TaxID=375541 RepID=A0A8I0G2M7_9ACTN|nr:hypothetical protein [Aeromicrobium tamlense]
MHQKPAASHIDACHPWREGELEVVRPRVVVCLGATAGRSVLGRTVRIREERGHVLEVDAPYAVVLTTHPSALLRLRDRGDDATGCRTSPSTCDVPTRRVSDYCCSDSSSGRVFAARSLPWRLPVSTSSCAMSRSLRLLCELIRTSTWNAAAELTP